MMLLLPNAPLVLGCLPRSLTGQVRKIKSKGHWVNAEIRKWTDTPVSCSVPNLPIEISGLRSPKKSGGYYNKLYNLKLTAAVSVRPHHHLSFMTCTDYFFTKRHQLISGISSNTGRGKFTHHLLWIFSNSWSENIELFHFKEDIASAKRFLIITITMKTRVSINFLVGDQW